VQTIAVPSRSSEVASESCPRQAYVARVIERAGQLLPAQGPITAFVFLNSLQALEDLPFEEAVAKGARLFGCEPYLREDRYRDKLATGRIRREDLAAVLRADLPGSADVRISSLGSRLDLRLAMLSYPIRRGPADELRWFVAETEALTRLRDDVPAAVRNWIICETRRWVIRNWSCADNDAQRPDSPMAWLGDLLQKIGARRLERLGEAQWEALSVQALWHLCRDGLARLDQQRSPARRTIRLRDAMLEATSDDVDELVHEVLIRFSAAFADQGLTQWSLPHRDKGYYAAFCELYRQAAGPESKWLRGLAEELTRLQQSGIAPRQAIVDSLDDLGVVEDEWDDYLTATLLALRGWAGMIRQMEVRGDRVGIAAPPGSVVEFVAVRLILERFALAHLAAKHWNYRGPLARLREFAAAKTPTGMPRGIEQRAFPVFQIAQTQGWAAPLLERLAEGEWATLVGEIESFSGLERRRIFHLAFERRFRNQVLDALSIHARREAERVEAPHFQAVFCIDTREESFRRQLEEYAPRTETFGAAGFFCIPIYYRGIADAHFAALCPIVVRPRHWVVEDVVFPLEDQHRRRARTRRAIGTASHHLHLGSRSIGRGALLAAGLGVLASVPLVARVLFPRLTARIRRTAGSMVGPPPITRLRLERTAPVPGPQGDQVGFTIEEMADHAERLLRDIGLTSGFARLVFFLGHGSACLNNPHKSAYDCGACSGGAGGPNARALAAMLNNYRVRAVLARRGLEVPVDTLFVGGLHNTCEDSITFYDLDLLPSTHIEAFHAARETLARVCERNAHERCRRFESAPLNLMYAAAHRHVEGRAEDLAQTRPEYGNATNAICIVGRRERTRGLFLDRRSFLISYDPAQDGDDYAILARILAAVVPVCEGINLQYYFSSIDSQGWGSGTKLPHNITSLLGVMDGAASDLRTGLPWQGVEIHEPLRLLFIIETTPKAVSEIMEANEVISRIIRNGWVQLALLDPLSNAISVFRDGAYHDYQSQSESMPVATSSVEWYRGRRDHLPFAAIGNFPFAAPMNREFEEELCFTNS
jgi:uncharacterized protein YbcC (UPF0753/DUF2309 family)